VIVHLQGHKFACVCGASYSMVLHTQLYYAPHTASWTLFLFFMHYALHTPLRTAFFWVVMQRVVVRNYHYLLCYNPEEQFSATSQQKPEIIYASLLYSVYFVLLEHSLASLSLPDILFIWLTATLPWCTYQFWMICGND
jgi:hypothetical protein